MINLIKSAEVYGSEAIVYNGSKAPPDLYIDLIVNNKLEPGRGSGFLYGKGVYTTYNLPGTATAGGTYGSFVYKLKVNLYGFISFNPDITKKIYGEDLTPSQQYEKIYGRKDYIFKGLKDLESAERFYEFSSDLADPASRFLRGIVKGLIFTGRNDGDVAVIYDPSTIVPIAWKKTEDSSWSGFSKDQIKPAIGRGISGSFEKLKYDEVDASRDRGALESINILSNFHGDNPGKKEIASINYLIANAPITFLSEYSKKDWAKDYIKAAVGRSLFIISPEEFLKQFKDKPWLESNSGNVAKSCSEREPYFFLYNFKDKPWAKDYIPIAAKNLAERSPSTFLDKYIDEPWAKEYIPLAAKTFAEGDPYYFLDNFINEPWAQEYIPAAAERCAKEDHAYFLNNLINEPWALKHIPLAAKNCAEQQPSTFLHYFINEPWAKDYIPLAAKNLADRDPYGFQRDFSHKSWAKEPIEDLDGKSFVQYAKEMLQKQSSYSTKLTKLAKVLKSLGLSEEAFLVLKIR